MLGRSGSIHGSMVLPGTEREALVEVLIDVDSLLDLDRLVLAEDNKDVEVLRLMLTDIESDVLKEFVVLKDWLALIDIEVLLLILVDSDKL